MGLEPCEFGLCLAHFLAQLTAFEPQVLSERLQVAGGAQHGDYPRSSRLLGRKMSDTCTGVRKGGVAAAWPLVARAQSSLCAHGMVSEQSISRTTVPL